MSKSEGKKCLKPWVQCQKCTVSKYVLLRCLTYSIIGLNSLRMWGYSIDICLCRCRHFWESTVHKIMGLSLQRPVGRNPSKLVPEVEAGLSHREHLLQGSATSPIMPVPPRVFQERNSGTGTYNLASDIFYLGKKGFCLWSVLWDSDSH